MKTEYTMPGFEFAEIIDWCLDNFGGAFIADDGWDTYQHTSLNNDNNLVPCRIFIFHREEDAMAFKLRWL